MTVVMFLPRFEPPILARTKRQTIRPRARCKPGDELSLRRWSGKPYRSTHAVILPRVVCTAVLPIWVGVVDPSPQLMIAIAGERLAGDQVDAFARADGFGSAAEMAEYYRGLKTESFDGFLHRWEDPS